MVHLVIFEGEVQMVNKGRVTVLHGIVNEVQTHHSHNHTQSVPH